tara:strand:+ start:439 stop:720 length:282 start_codon:yes stop_codon:yes gene_type:complete
MTDNILKFPKRNLEVDVELEESEEEYHEMVEAIVVMMEMHTAGLIVTSDAKWQHVMDAAMSVAVNAGLRAGMSTEEIEETFESVRVQEVKYDA